MSIYDMTLGDIVNTAGMRAFDIALEDITRPRTAWDIQKATAQNKADFAAYQTLRDSYLGLGSTAAWMLRRKDGSYEDANIAARLFSAKTTWRDCVDDVDYGRIAALIAAL